MWKMTQKLQMKEPRNAKTQWKNAIKWKIPQYDTSGQDFLLLGQDQFRNFSVALVRFRIKIQILNPGKRRMGANPNRISCSSFKVL